MKKENTNKTEISKKPDDFFTQLFTHIFMGIILYGFIMGIIAIPYKYFTGYDYGQVLSDKLNYLWQNFGKVNSIDVLSDETNTPTFIINTKIVVRILCFCLMTVVFCMNIYQDFFKKDK